MVRPIRNIVFSSVPPLDKTTGWLKPLQGKALELNFFVNGAWVSVSGTGGGSADDSGITDLKFNVTDPLQLSSAIENGVATISGSVDIQSIPVSEIAELF